MDSFILNASLADVTGFSNHELCELWIPFASNFCDKQFDPYLVRAHITMTCSQSDLDMSAAAKLTILKGTDSLQSSKVVSTIAMLKDISINVKALLKIIEFGQNDNRREWKR